MPSTDDSIGSRSVVFAAGGSGGHIFPAVALAEELKAADPSVQITLVTSAKEVDQSIAGGLEWKHVTVPAISPGEWRRHPWRVLRDNWRAWRMATRLLHETSASVVVGSGGFASMPVLFAARRAGIPIVLLEQNAIPGRVTRWAAGWAKSICCAFEEATAALSRNGNAVTTGNPVRRSIREAREISRPKTVRPTLVVLGGSQGSHAINSALKQIATSDPQMFTGWTVIHQTGVTDQQSVEEAYRKAGVTAEVQAFIPDLASVYERATLAVSRAGGTTLAELACVGVPALLVPYPFAADDHQRANARWFEKSGAARVVDQSGASPIEERLRTELAAWMQDETLRTTAAATMRGWHREAHRDVGLTVLNFL
jgi:UDP-N-acetylglucosamine--N-acetylmuramyl-(pentapeptide) pyrophosphoryl-undecaprenol N-acetylglucosamine transferase